MDQLQETGRDTKHESWGHTLQSIAWTCNDRHL